jgi:hypothetical protein
MRRRLRMNSSPVFISKIDTSLVDINQARR